MRRFNQLSAVLLPLCIAMSGAVWAPATSAAPGDLDPTFGTAGTVTTPILTAGHEDPPSMALQPDGRIVLAGYTWTSNGAMALARYNADGSLDTSFGGGDGVALAPFSDVERGRAQAVALQPDGKIVTVGETGEADLLIARFNADGSLDTSFGGGDGFVSDGFDAYLTIGNAVGLQPDGKIVVGGQYLVSEEVEEDTTFTNHAFVARFNADGSVDTDFGDEGLVVTLFGAEVALAESLALQPNGAILLGGYAWEGGNESGIARFLTDGTLDTTFGGGDGYATTTAPGAAAMVLQSDGKIVFGGSRFSQFGVGRLNTDGTPDVSFGEGGITETVVGSPYSWIYGLALQPNGAIIAAGGVGILFSSEAASFALTRYQPDGSLDTTFGSSGIVTTSFGGESFATTAVVQPDGRIVAGGEGNGEFALARYEGGEGEPPDEEPDDEPSEVPTPPSVGQVPSSTPTPVPTIRKRRIKCRRGFMKKKVRGKVRCVKKRRRN